MLLTVLFARRLSNSSKALSPLWTRGRLIGDVLAPDSLRLKAGTLHLGRQDPASFSPGTSPGR
jgi:hypothetical protein